MLIPDDLDTELDGFVERFEEARAVRPDVDVADYLPTQSHPRYAHIACELLRVDMELSAASGRFLTAADYQHRFPQVCQQSIYLRALQSEESRVRRASQGSASPTSGSKSASKPGPNSSSTSRQLSCNEVPDGEMPVAGQSICGFQLLTELGQGAFSRVYLALDDSLAQRRVVLKVSSQLIGEADTLSRLQHKNIVPVYSLHRVNEYHMICMPFLGTLTMADLLKGSQATEPGSLSGKALISTLAAKASRTWKDEAEAVASSTSISIHESDRPHAPGLSSQLTSQVANMSTAELALWIIAELADGLAHAHERGILHRDIKPANVLLSDDGLPMLLDFNLAANINPQHNPSDVMGGTLRYMAPEQIAAVRDRQNCLDARADIYSLGVVLYELLWQRPPFKDRTGSWSSVLHQMDVDRQQPPPLNVAWRLGITPAVISILQRALTYRTEDRYQSAAELRDDLRAHLQSKPLRVAADRSLRERVRKWNVRHPRLSSMTIVTVLAIALLLGTTAWFLKRQSTLGHLQAIQWLHELQASQSQARSLLASSIAPASEINRLLDQSSVVLSPVEMQQHMTRLDDQQLQLAVETLGRVHFYRARGALGMLRRVTKDERGQWLKLAQEELQQSLHYSALPMARQWLEAIEPLVADALTPEQLEAKFSGSQTKLTSWLQKPQSLRQDLAAAERATHEEASNPWHWIGVGQLQLSMEQVAPAQASFTLGRSLDDQNMLPAFYLGVVEMKLKHFAAAEEWFNHALALDPTCSEALINRAATRVELKHYAEAIQDVETLGEQTKRYPRAWFIRELAEQQLGRRSAAIKSRKQGLSLEPTDALSWNARGEARLRSTPVDASAALADFDQAIALDPHFRNAYENAAHVLSEYLKRPQLAIERLDAAVGQVPDYPLAWSSRAVLHARLGNYVDSQRDVEQALKLDRTAMVCYQCASAMAIVEGALGKASEDDEGKSKVVKEATHGASSLQLLKETLRKEPSLSKFMRSDQDLHSLLNNPEFEELLIAAAKLQ